MVSHYVNSRISTQHRASVLFLLELFFVRECVLSCPVLSVDNIDSLLILYAFLDAGLCLQCFDAVGWVAGKASGL